MGRTQKGPKVAWFTRLKASLDISENVKTLGSVPTKDLLCFHQLCVKEINQVNMHTGWKGEQYLRRMARDILATMKPNVKSFNHAFLTTTETHTSSCFVSSSEHITPFPRKTLNARYLCNNTEFKPCSFVCLHKYTELIIQYGGTSHPMHLLFICVFTWILGGICFNIYPWLSWRLIN